jgi:hypothetical protein
MHDAEPWQPSVNLHYPLVNVNKKLSKITIFNGKIHYNWPCSIAMLNYQRVVMKQIMMGYEDGNNLSKMIIQCDILEILMDSSI